MVYGVKEPLIVDFKKMPAGSKAPNGEMMNEPFYVVNYDFVLQKRAHAAAAVERAYRPVEPLERELAGGLGAGRVLDGGLHLAVDEDLPVLGVGAQARREIDHRADRRIVEPALEADAAERGIAVGDAHAETELVTGLAPFDSEFRDMDRAFPSTCARRARSGPDKAAGR